MRNELTDTTDKLTNIETEKEEALLKISEVCFPDFQTFDSRNLKNLSLKFNKTFLV